MFDPYVLGDDASEEQKRIGWATALKINEIISKALYEEHKQFEEEIRQFASEGPEVFTVTTPTLSCGLASRFSRSSD